MCNISLPVLPNWLESVRIKHWFPCGADGRAGGWAGCVRSRDYQNFLGLVDLLTHGAPQARLARQSSAIMERESMSTSNKIRVVPFTLFSL